ncbi:RNA-splicing ligase RtcB [Niallia circulans]|uniref:3'-phosphate/5'-hydroxy nucleic acid ligase n=1 Tax=Niallia circulans TaxID=1397 RepID=A0A553SNL6_NIACI|nr:RtcB family protein [Niallia circulans]TRZ38585.1 RNA-splicing ligase RtcB [Niallia circulans]
MLEVQGKYNIAKVYTDKVEETAMSQILELCDQEFTKGTKIRIMPDTHAGAGCTIGTTMTITDKIVPNLVGVDIGCGMEVAVIDKNKTEVNFDQLDEVIRKHIPSGFSTRESSQFHPYSKRVEFRNVVAPFSLKRAKSSVGTLGGGNHFVELNEMDDKIVLVIHSGSRNLGKQIADHYQNLAYNELLSLHQEKQGLIDELKAAGRESEIEETLKALKRPYVKKDLAYLQGKSFEHYMNDMKIAQHYALLNRKAMVEEITSRMRWNILESFTTIHNYIDMEQMILRKGAISARKDEKVIIPMNMRDGSIIAIGKGNKDWNESAPHGAGRLMSRTKAKELVSLEQFKDVMKDVWTTSVNEGTLDESPMAYKPMEDIIKHTDDTIEIVQVIKPLYNFKAN